MDQMLAFDSMLSVVSADGRGERLLGDVSLARRLFEESLFHDSAVVAILEFPLLGDPYADVFSLSWKVGEVIGDVCGYRDAMTWYSGLGANGTTCIGLTMSGSESGLYFQYRHMTDLIEPFFESVGEDPAPYLSARDRVPDGWDAQYVGLFPSRGYVRLGGYMDRSESDRCAVDRTHLLDCLRSVGYDWPADVGPCSDLMRGASSVDFQFDVMPDGGVGDTFGLSLSMDVPGDAKELFESGHGARVCSQVESMGLADDRWRMLSGMHHSEGMPDGSVLWVHPSHVKVKFSGGVPVESKAYVTMTAVGRESL